MPTYLHLELLDLFPGYFAKVELALPPEEAGNALPDVLDEALWNLNLYRRLQRPDGGVGGGVESTAHPRGGECSWQESLCVGTFAPDPESSLRYAACAAKASRLAAPYDDGLAGELQESALRAWRWAEANAGRFLEAAPNRARSVAHMRALAGAELARVTGDRAYADASAESLGFDAPFDVFRHAWFAYALLPDDMADPALKQKAVDGYRMLGDTALEFASGNAFNVTTDIPGLPMIGYVGYWSTPGMTVGPGLPRAHYLTGEDKYLAGTVAACNFSVGANPMNMTMTIGVGYDYPRAPLHIDSRRSGQPAPAGITVFGPSDPRASGGAYDWAHQWKLGPDKMVPGSRTWPASEFYTDIYAWPPMNEYTVQQTLGPTSYHWGYLAARQ
jgi:endoglucanase